MVSFFTVLLIVFSLLIASMFSFLWFGFKSLNRFELKQKAQKHNKQAKLLYPLHALGSQLYASLVFGGLFANVVFVVILAQNTHGLLAITEATVALVVFVICIPILLGRRYILPVGSMIYPVLKWYMLVLAPLMRPIGRFFEARSTHATTQLISKDELRHILDSHESSEYSDIEEDEIHIVRHALDFGTKQVRSVMTPRRVVMSVGADDEIGPILLDELHKSGYSRFPVYNDKKTLNFIGTLYLHDLATHQTASKVKEVMRKEVLYIHEEQMLDHALQVFIKHNHHLMVVVNNFEEFVGVVTLEDVVEEILGREIVDEFDAHTDLRAVARSLAEQERKKRETSDKK